MAAYRGQQENLTEEEKKAVIMECLEKGTGMTVLHQNKTEFLNVKVIMETRQVARRLTKDKFLVFMDLFEIREIRRGKNSKDFEDNKDESTKEWDENTCFTILYGSEFVLNTLSIAADLVQDAETWVTGLELLRQETLVAPSPLIIKRWLRKHMYSISKTKKNSISMKELKSLFLQLNYKVPSVPPLEDRLQEVGATNDTMDFEQFHELCKLIMFSDQKKILEEFDFIKGSTDDSDSEVYPDSEVLLHDFQKFLRQQGESWARDKNKVRELMKTFIDDTMRKTSGPGFTVSEFLSFLFSKENSIWDEKFSETNNQDMKNPLSHYWINSSHNTYLTGGQLRSKSSKEAYIRCLRLGCRCVELDCWDGPGGEPIIYHGRTMTTKIKFTDVVKAIKKHAFITSNYPVILSIEQHCSKDQQIKMAAVFKDVFDDKLLTKPVEKNAEQLPSPTQLMGKIIIKHKKLKHNTQTMETGTSRTLDKQGYLHIWDPIDQCWNTHYCMISNGKLYYAEEEDKQEDPRECHHSEPWFHGRVREGRQRAERLLQESGGRDGTFLVRESDTYVGVYTLSLWLRKVSSQASGRTHHRPGEEGYYLEDTLHYPDIYTLIQHHKDSPSNIIGSERNFTLTDAILQPDPHLKEGWFYSNLSRDLAELFIMKIPRDGAFLIRQREGETDSFAITFRGDSKVKHCRIQKEDSIYRNLSIYRLGSTMEFDSLVELVNHFRKRPLYRKTKLRYPVTPELVKRFSKLKDCASIYNQTYVAPNETSMPPNTFRAMYSYEAKSPDDLSFRKGDLLLNVSKDTGFEGWWKGDCHGELQLFFPSNHVEEVSNNETKKPRITVRALDFYQAKSPDELSFRKGDLIHNVSKDTAFDRWWKGDCHGKLQLLFPSNHVEEVSNNARPETKQEDHNPLGADCQGVVDITQCKVQRVPNVKKAHVMTVQDVQNDSLKFDLATDSMKDFNEWFRVARSYSYDSQDKGRTTLQDDRDAELSEKSMCSSSDMSDLVVYCQSRGKEKFDKMTGDTHKEVRSFGENKVPFQSPDFLQYNRTGLSRIYPKGERVDSSNYDPYPMWAAGCHMVALNFQTADKATQLNSALFSLNERTGYVLQPKLMDTKGYDPNPNPQDKKVVKYNMVVRVLGARHLPKLNRNITCPSVEIELCGHGQTEKNFFKIHEESKTIFKTAVFRDNGLNPVWEAPAEPVTFEVFEPELTFIRFVVKEEDLFSDRYFLAQATFPFRGLRTGYRSVPLKNGNSESLELASLLVHIHIKDNAMAMTPDLEAAQTQTPPTSAGVLPPKSRRIIKPHNKKSCEIKCRQPIIKDDDTRRKKKNTVGALYDYQALAPDELSFSEGDLIYNVFKENDIWWKVDCHGKQKMFFPAKNKLYIRSETT